MIKINKKSILMLVLNLLLVTTIILSEYIYTSYYDIFSWHENSGIQFLSILMILAPILLLLSIVYYFLGKKGIVSGINKNLPVISLVIFLAPILLDTSLSTLLITIGTILGLILSIVSIVVLLKRFFTV
jgi:hypothetical protein